MYLVVALVAIATAVSAAPLARGDCTPRKLGKVVNNIGLQWKKDYSAVEGFIVPSAQACSDKCAVLGARIMLYKTVTGASPSNCQCLHPWNMWINAEYDSNKAISSEQCEFQPTTMCAYPMYCDDHLHKVDWKCMDGTDDCDTQYKINYKKETWDDAKAHCENVEGGVMASFHNDVEESWLDNQVKGYNNLAGHTNPDMLTWLGVQPGDVRDVWVNTDGSAFDYNKLAQVAIFRKWEVDYRVYVQASTAWSGSTWFTGSKSKSEFSVCSRVNPATLEESADKDAGGDAQAEGGPVGNCVNPEEDHIIESDGNGIFLELNGCHFDVANSCACQNTCQQQDGEDHLSFQWKENEAPNCCCFVEV